MVTWSSTRLQRTYNVEKIVSTINGVGKTGYPHAGEWHWTRILHYTQKSVQNRLDLYVRPESIKLLEENIWKNPLDFDVNNGFFGIWHQKQRQQKQK